MKIKGFTLTELLLVIMIIGFMTVMTVPVTGHFADSTKTKLTDEFLISIKEAIVGPAGVYDSKGRRVIGGYVRDTGYLPKLYTYKWDKE